MLKKIIEIISNLIEYLRNRQLIQAGEDNIKNKIAEAENEASKKISDIQSSVDKLSADDVERLLDIKVKSK